MKTKTENFTMLKGHVAENCVVISPSGKEFTLKPTMNGWRFVDSDKREVSENLKSAFEVECFVVNELQNC
jgi:hypothetical protein